MGFLASFGKRGSFQILIVLGILFVFLFAWGIFASDTLPTFLTPAIDSVQGQPSGEGTEFFLRMYPWMPVILVVVGLFTLVFGGNR